MENKTALTPDQLLQPRYKVIAGYPKCLYNIGRILTPVKWNKDTFECIDAPASEHIFRPDKYPHLFRKLSWWEDRQPEDMPEYVKQTGMVDCEENPLPDVYLKVIKHFNAGNGEWRDDSVNIFCADSYLTGLKRASYSYSDWLPATKQDWEYYNKLKNV